MPLSFKADRVGGEHYNLENLRDVVVLFLASFPGLSPISASEVGEEGILQVTKAVIEQPGNDTSVFFTI